MLSIIPKLLLWLISLLMLNLPLLSMANEENAAITKVEGLFVPDTPFFNEQGEKVFLDQFEDKTVLLCFWATWCGPCAQEMPSLDVLQKDFRKLPFAVVALSEDFNGLEVIKAHYAKYGIRHLNIYHDYRNQLFNAMHVVGLPTAYLISPEGKIKLMFKGNVKWHDEKIREMILAEIAGNPEMPKNTYVVPALMQEVVYSQPPPEEAKRTQVQNTQASSEKSESNATKGEGAEKSVTQESGNQDKKGNNAKK